MRIKSNNSKVPSYAVKRMLGYCCDRMKLKRSVIRTLVIERSTCNQFYTQGIGGNCFLKVDNRDSVENILTSSMWSVLHQQFQHSVDTQTTVWARYVGIINKHSQPRHSELLSAWLEPPAKRATKPKKSLQVQLAKKTRKELAKAEVGGEGSHVRQITLK